MGELPSPGPEELISTESTSRFGNEMEILEELTNGEAHILGSIDEQFPGIISRHRNEVDITEIDLTEGKPIHLSSAQTVELDLGGNKMLAVFKPFDGEDKDFQSAEFPHSFYGRERAAYLVSQHFGFDIVPPTVVREINGRIGSLQQFMPPEEYLPGQKAFENVSDDDLDAIQQSEDIMKLQLLDHILANPDRNRDNFLVKVDGNGRVESKDPQLVAIDHGISFDDRYYRTAANYEAINGPYIFLTYDNMSRSPRSTPVPESLSVKLRFGLEDVDNLKVELGRVDGIEEGEIEKLQLRAEELIRGGVFLSPLNIKRV